MANESKIGMFRDINERLRQKNSEMVLALAQRSGGERIPFGIIKPLPAALTGAFGEERSFFLHGTEAGGSVHEGYDLADKLGAGVSVAADGVVLHAGPLGIFGNAIVVDHGLGFQTLYGHLSVIEVKAGDVVTSGMRMGSTGMTGLAGGDHLHFETRVHGVAVDPKEWLDPHWIATRIKEPLEDLVKSQQS
jgi:murein DD-endopeptidase MepM/ murein hydrolase activator NlpD